MIYLLDCEGDVVPFTTPLELEYNCLDSYHGYTTTYYPGISQIIGYRLKCHGRVVLDTKSEYQYKSVKARFNARLRKGAIKDGVVISLWEIAQEIKESG